MIIFYKLCVSICMLLQTIGLKYVQESKKYLFRITLLFCVIYTHVCLLSTIHVPRGYQTQFTIWQNRFSQDFSLWQHFFIVFFFLFLQQLVQQSRCHFDGFDLDNWEDETNGRITIAEVQGKVPQVRLQ